MTSTEREWTPLLDGPEAEAALAHARAIGALLRDRPPLDVLRAGGVARGHAGLAILHAQLDLVCPDEGWDGAASAALERAGDELMNQRLGPDLFAGIAGVAYTAHLLDAATARETAEVDQQLLRLLDAQPWRGGYDLTGGLVGLGAYGCLRMRAGGGEDDFGRSCAARVLDRLTELARPAGDGLGLTFWTPGHQAVARDFREGLYDCGLAHGVPGVLAFLAELGELGFRTDEAAALADGIVPWILAQRFTSPDMATEVFPAAVGPGISPAPGRLGWCYGEVTVGMALLRAARAFARPAWESEARRTLIDAATVPIDRSGVRDACICHGAAGLAHLFHRLGLATGEAALAAAARRWLTQALAMHAPDTGLAGWRFYVGQPAGGKLWTEEPGLLLGAAGVALVFATACARATPTWDQLLLTPR